MCVSFLVIPYSIVYFNSNDYGLWLTISSILSWFIFFDVGIGLGLKNKLAEANANANFQLAKEYISTTYAIISIISLTLFVVFYVINNIINWNLVLNTNINLEELRSIILSLFGIFSLMLILQPINIVLQSLHKQTILSFIAFLNSSLIAIVIISLKVQHFIGPSLKMMVLIFGGIPLVVQIISSLYIFKFKLAKFKPNYQSIDFSKFKDLMSLGFVFFLLQLGSLALFQTDTIIISRFLGTKSVTIFNVVYKYFSTILILIAIIMAPLWTAFTDAFNKNDYDWIKRIFWKLNKFWLVISVFTFILLIFSDLFFNMWLKNSVIIDHKISIFMTFYVIASSFFMINCYLVNGIGKLILQLLLYILITIINIPMSIFFLKTMNISGVILSNIICLIIMSIFLFIQNLKLINRTATGIWNK